MNTRNTIGLLLLTAALASCGGTPSGGAGGDPEFTLAAQPAELSVGPSHSGTTSIRITRLPRSGGQVSLTLEGASAGTGADRIRGAFGGQEGGISALTLTVGANVPAGTYPLTVRGTNGTITKTIGVQVKVEKWLLVDADRSANNAAPQRTDAPLSPLDLTMRAVLAGRAFDVFVVRSGSIATDVPAINGPGAEALARYTGVLWYTGNQWDQPPTPDDLSAMTRYLSAPDHRLVLQSAAFVQHLDGTGNVYQGTDQNTDRNALQKAFLRDQLGVAGYTFQYRRDAPEALPVHGSATQGMGALRLSNPASVVAFKRLNDPNGQALLTVSVNADERGAVAVRKKGLGGSGRSTAVYLGLSPDEIEAGDAAGLLQRLLRD